MTNALSTTDSEPVSKRRFKKDRDSATPKTQKKPVRAEEPGLESILTPTMEWFGSMLRGFLMVYVVVLAAATVWLRTGTSHQRLWIVAALSIPLVYQIVFRPINRRLALRGILRRGTTRSTAAAVLAAAAVLSASTTIADSVAQTKGVFAKRHLGPVDVLSVASSEKARLQFLAAVERQQSPGQDGSVRIGNASMTDATDGRILFTSTRASVSSPTAPLVGGVDVFEFAMEEAIQFGNEPEATGLAGTGTLSGATAYIGADLAADLDVRTGSTVTVLVDGASRTFAVQKVLPRVGLGALAVDGRPRPRVLFVPRGSVSAMPSTTQGLVRYITAYSAKGPSSETWRQSRSLADVLAQAIEAGVPPEAAGGSADSGIVATAERIDATAVAVKANLLEFELRGTKAFQPISSGLAAIAGLGAVVSLLAALALSLDRRRREAGALRSIGLSRNDTLATTAVELGLVSLASVLVGSVVGWVLAAVALSRSTTGSVGSYAGSALSFPTRLVALSTSVSTAFAVAMLTIFLISYLYLRSERAADSNLSTADRVEPNATDAESDAPAKKGSLPRRQLILFGLMVALGVGLIGRGVWKESGLQTLAGTAALGAILERAFRANSTRIGRLRRPLAMAFVVAVSLLALLGVRSGYVTAGDFGLYSSLVLLAGCAFAGWFGNGSLKLPKPLGQLAKTMRAVGSKVRTPAALVMRPIVAKVEALVTKESVSSAPVSAALRSTLEKAQQSRRPLHGLIIRVLSAFGVFSAVVSLVLSSSVQQTVTRLASNSQGRFGAVLRTDDLVIISALRNRPEVSEVAGVKSRYGSIARQNSVPIRSVVSSLDESYSAAPGVARLAARSPKAASDQQAFLMLLDNPDAVIVDRAVVPGIRPSALIGSQVFVADDESGRSATMTVVGVSESGAGLGDVLVGPQALDRLRNENPTNNSVLVSFSPGVDIDIAVAGLRTQLKGEIDSFAGVAGEQFRSQRTVASLIGQLSKIMLLGSLVTGLVIVRSALSDRRRDLASLRTFGAVDGVLRRVITSEYRHMAMVGSLVGLLVALPASWHLIGRTDPALVIAIPMLRLLVLALVLMLIANVVLTVLAHVALKGSPTAVLHANTNAE
jgi:ABC-type antimicrobial peptide transport system permease subunit